MIRALLCDADGCLFPSEEPAFAASAGVTNRLLADHGIDVRFEPEQLKAYAVGRNFRATALELAAAHGVAIDPLELERRVEEERDAVIDHLREVLTPDPAVLGPLTRLAERCELAVVSSSALARLDACFEATGLAELFPPAMRFSAEDSLPVPASKPDPAVYALAGERLGVAGEDALAVEDSASGARSALAAGFPTIGNAVFVPPAERAERVAALRRAGVAAVVGSWDEVEEAVSRRWRSSSAPAARSPAR
ncbi:MAG TPA: HAD family phosphatase [Solirubrobacteraceae bacterium]|nr:HAD family phosphatase [Solirubrobacteraceae bacterium]